MQQKGIFLCHVSQEAGKGREQTDKTQQQCVYCTVVPGLRFLYTWGDHLMVPDVALIIIVGCLNVAFIFENICTVSNNNIY